MALALESVLWRAFATPDHQGLLAVVHRHDGFLGEYKAGTRPREPREDQSRHDGQQRHPDEDFRCCDEMAEMGLRMHVAVTDRRKGLDREIEQVHEVAGGNVGDRLMAEEEDKRKCAIERDEDERGAREEDGPGDAHRSMIQIGPESAVQSLGYDLTIANSDDVGSGIF